MSLSQSLEEFIWSKLKNERNPSRSLRKLVDNYIKKEKNKKDFIDSVLHLYCSAFLNTNLWPLKMLVKITNKNEKIPQAKKNCWDMMVMFMSLQNYCSFKIPLELDAVTRDKIISLSQSENTMVSFANQDFMNKYINDINGNILNLLGILFTLTDSGQNYKHVFNILTFMLGIPRKQVFSNVSSLNIVKILFEIVLVINQRNKDAHEFITCCQILYFRASGEKTLAVNTKYIKLLYISYYISVKRNSITNDSLQTGTSIDFLFTYHSYDTPTILNMEYEKMNKRNLLNNNNTENDEEEHQLQHIKSLNLQDESILINNTIDVFKKY
jgi:hypothetical protein